MRLNTKGRYAVTAILDVALHGAEGPVRLASIAERQNISQSYLEQLFASLRRAGLVSSIRGPGGGYRLAHDAQEISIAQVIAAVNERVDATRCGGHENCQENEPCLTHGLWAELGEEIERYLRSVRLSDVLQWRQVRQVAQRQNLKFMEMHKYSDLKGQEVRV